MLMLGLMFSLMAVMLLFIRIGNANDLRSQAQTAADAAALAAANDTQERMAESLAAGGTVHFAPWQPDTGEDAARKYAKKNGGIVTDIRASDTLYSGYAGNYIRVVVRGAQCQRELDDERTREWNDTACDGTEKEKEIDTFSGEAASIARVDMPNCSLFEISKDYFRPKCNGRIIYDKQDAIAEINVQLDDEEGKYLFDPAASFSGDNSPLAGGKMGPCDAPGADNTTPLMCATHKAVLEKFTPPKGAGCYRADGGWVVGQHPLGRACDYMMANGQMPSAKNQALGQALADWLVANADKLGVMYIIWRQEIWTTSKRGQGWVPMSDRGGDITQNHYDHVHLSVN